MYMIKPFFRCDMTSSELEHTHDTDRRLDRAEIYGVEMCRLISARQPISYKYITYILYRRDMVKKLCTMISLATRF